MTLTYTMDHKIQSYHKKQQFSPVKIKERFKKT